MTLVWWGVFSRFPFIGLYLEISHGGNIVLFTLLDYIALITTYFSCTHILIYSRTHILTYSRTHILICSYTHIQWFPTFLGLRHSNDHRRDWHYWHYFSGRLWPMFAIFNIQRKPKHGYRLITTWSAASILEQDDLRCPTCSFRMCIWNHSASKKVDRKYSYTQKN